MSWLVGVGSISTLQFTQKFIRNYDIYKRKILNNIDIIHEHPLFTRSRAWETQEDLSYLEIFLINWQN